MFQYFQHDGTKSNAAKIRNVYQATVTYFAALANSQPPGA